MKIYIALFQSSLCKREWRLTHNINGKKDGPAGPSIPAIYITHKFLGVTTYGGFQRVKSAILESVLLTVLTQMSIGLTGACSFHYRVVQGL